MIEYTLIRSRRKTVAVEVGERGVIVRAPMRMPKRAIEAFVRQHESWIEQKLSKHREEQLLLSAVDKLSAEEIAGLYERARDYLPGRAQYYAEQLGEAFGRVTIRCQRTRWGSCSASRNLNFNCLLMLAPPGVIDAVVVHEVCHLREMNHSPRFYELVLELCPDYRRLDRWLKENGKVLLARIPDEEREKDEDQP